MQALQTSQERKQAAQAREIEGVIVNALARELGVPISAARHFRGFYLREQVVGEPPIIPMTGLPFRVRSDSEEYDDAVSTKERGLLREREILETQAAEIKARLAAIRGELVELRELGNLVNPYENSDDAQLVKDGLVALTGRPMKAAVNAVEGTPKVVQRAMLTARGRMLAEKYLTSERRSKRVKGIDLDAVVKGATS